MQINIPDCWSEYIDNKLLSDLTNCISEHSNIVPCDRIFDFLNYSKPEDIKVVIAGHAPYTNMISSSLAFSLNTNNINIKEPLELKKIKEGIRDSYSTVKAQYNLNCWAKQGVLLINKNLICKLNDKNFFSNYNWNKITLEIIKKHSEKYQNIYYLLLGSYAHQFDGFIYKKNNHKIVKYAYPTVINDENNLTYSECFLNINKYLKKINKTEIIW